MVIVIVGYFILTQKISTITIPTLPSISFSDLIKFSRFSLDKAPSTSLVGSITSMTGDVFFEPRLATESAKIVAPISIQQGESFSTGINGNLILNFKDATEVVLENDSGIDVIQTLPADLVFRQTLGTVDYKKIGTYPVSIRVGHLLVENEGDLKISFTGNGQSKDSPVTTVIVINGTATIAYNNLNNDSRMVNLTTGQILEFNEGNRRVVLK